MQAKAKLEAQISELAGYPVEITIRGERSFTFSFDAIDQAAAQRIANFFATAKTEIYIDDECEMTGVYVDV